MKIKTSFSKNKSSLLQEQIDALKNKMKLLEGNRCNFGYEKLGFQYRVFRFMFNQRCFLDTTPEEETSLSAILTRARLARVWTSSHSLSLENCPGTAEYATMSLFCLLGIRIMDLNKKQSGSILRK